MVDHLLNEPSMLLVSHEPGNGKNWREIGCVAREIGCSEAEMNGNGLKTGGCGKYPVRHAKGHYDRMP